MRSLSILLISTLALSTAAQAEEAVDWETVTRIRDEGFHHSQVLQTLSHLTDSIGPRLTGSPAMKEANDWTRQQLETWGLANAHLEGYDFGRGWTYSYLAVHLVEPRATPLLAVPKAWTPGTKGEQEGEVVQVTLASDEDLEAQKGKLKGKILILKENEDGPGRFRRSGSDRGPAPRRFAAEDLQQLEEFDIPTGDREGWRRFAQKRRQFQKKLNEFLVEEKVVATLEKSSREGGILRVGGGGSRKKGESVGVPALVLAKEHFTLLERLLDDEKTVKLKIEVKARFYDDDLQAYNTVAEIPGTDPEAGIVMAGAHLDSWHAGTGATDNGASCAIVMEAVRILQTLGVKPRRTIRVGLWSGEEQGLLGSRNYVETHFATPPPAEDEDNPFEERWPLTYQPDHAKLSAYFNLDNGGGRIRGVWGQENAGVQPIFEAWLEPFHDLGATALTQRNTSGTDHLSFDRAGLPGFQFIQDQMDYFAKTHHTNLDVLDYVEEQDLKQASVILASFLYHAATRDEALPRKPLPRAPEKAKEKKKGASGDSDEGDHP